MPTMALHTYVPNLVLFQIAYLYYAMSITSTSITYQLTRLYIHTKYVNVDTSGEPIKEPTGYNIPV